MEPGPNNSVDPTALSLLVPVLRLSPAVDHAVRSPEADCASNRCT
jgi:hypothetical protein